MAKDIRYRLAAYDGGLDAHPVPERAGQLWLVGSWWELHFRHAFVNGELTDYVLEALPIDKRSCLVSVRESENDGEILCSFVLPGTSAERFLSDLDQRSGEIEAGDTERAESPDGAVDRGHNEPTNFPVRIKMAIGQELELTSSSRFYELRSSDDRRVGLLDLYSRGGDLVRLVCAEGSWLVNKRRKYGWDLVIESADGGLVGSYSGRHWGSGGTISLPDGGHVDLRQSPAGLWKLRVAATGETIATIRGSKLLIQSLPAEIYVHAEVVVLTACAVLLLMPSAPAAPAGFAG